MEKTYQRARNYCLSLLKYRPRAKKEIRTRLEKRGYQRQIIDKIIEEFSEVGLIDDWAFTKFWINWRENINPKGSFAIKYELKQKGVEREIIEDFLKEISVEKEFSRAKELAQNRLERLRGLEQEKVKQRIYGYLARRGFAHSTILKVINDLFRRKNLSV